MLSFMLKRLLLAIVGFFLLTYAVWFITTPDGIHAFSQLGLASLLPARYIFFLQNILHGNLGTSLVYRTPALTLIEQAAPVTLMLLIPAFIIQEVLAVIIGVTASARLRSVFDRVSSNLMYIFNSMPVFWLGLLFMLFFSVDINLFLTIDIVNLRIVGTPFGTPDYWRYFHAHTFSAIFGLIHHLTLPISVIVLAGMAADSQLTRASMLDVLGQEYIRAARARGLSERRVIWKHAFRNAVFPLLANISIEAPQLVFTTAIVEYTFALPGLGNLFILSVRTPTNSLGAAAPTDPNIVTAYFLLLGIVALIWSIFTDIAYALVDPRIRESQTITNAYSLAPQQRESRFNTPISVGPVKFTLTQIMAGALVIAIAFYSVWSVKQSNYVRAQQQLNGTWYGSLVIANSSLQYSFAMNLSADTHGALRGNAIECSIAAHSVISTTPLTVTGVTDGINSVSLTIDSQSAEQDTIQITGALPAKFSVWNLSGQVVQSGFPSQLRMSLQMQGPAAQMHC